MRVETVKDEMVWREVEWWMTPGNPPYQANHIPVPLSGPGIGEFSARVNAFVHRLAWRV